MRGSFHDAGSFAGVFVLLVSRLARGNAIAKQFARSRRAKLLRSFHKLRRSNRASISGMIGPAQLHHPCGRNGHVSCFIARAAMFVKAVLSIPPLRWALCRIIRWRVQEKMAEIEPYLNSHDRILDVGSGNSVLTQELRGQGYKVLPVDVKNHSFVDEIVPILYDGRILPFCQNSFDVALLITVLHHTSDPDSILNEARRVARRIIVIEEIYENRFEKYFTYVIDSLFNLEFFGHPRSNRTDSEWRRTFNRLCLNVRSADYSRSLAFLRRVTYVLDRA
jgi:SAM-dependent methyltransferase